MPYVPTIGHPAVVFDAHVNVAISGVENRPSSWAMTDVDAAASLGRIVDGPIRTKDDLAHAESALRAMLFHQHVEVLVPTAKVISPELTSSYVRLDTGIRNEASFAAMQVAGCFDRMITIESLRMDGDRVQLSSRHGSPAVSNRISDLPGHFRSFLTAAGELSSALPAQIGVSTYFTAPELSVPLNAGGAGFIDLMYTRMYRAWTEVAQAAPPIHIDVKLPPMLSIVLSRAMTREKIPEVLAELRQQLQAARDEFVRLNQVIEGTRSQADIIAQTQRLGAAYDAIVPEAMLTDAERRWRRIATVWSWAKPLRHLYSIAVDPLAMDPAQFRKFYRETRDAVSKTKRVIARSVAAESIAEMLRVPSIRETVETHFTKEEVRIIMS